MTEMIMKLLRKLLICITLLTAGIVNAQLNNFGLEVSKTNETCPGNGTLTFMVNNLTPGASVLYKVFKMPDTNNPIAIQQENTLGSLTSATYRVIAIQTLNDLQNTQQKDITISNNIGNFNFNVTSSNNTCSGGGTITITTTSGIATQYEIISGPVTRPLQTSNVFSNMPSGAYNIRVFNNCGQGKVKSYTLNLIESVLNISDTSYPPMANPVCNQILISNTITPSAGAISYPITVKHTLEPIALGGTQTVITQVFQTGDPASLTVTALVPRYQTEDYGYEITVTDNCNAVYVKEDGRVEAGIEVMLADQLVLCGEKYLTITPSKHKAPYTIAITGPEGFTTSEFNTQGNGPFFTPSVTYGDADNTIPFGMYTVTLTDACGRVAVDSLDVKFVPPVPALKATNNGCFSLFGRIRVSVPQQQIVTIKMIGAPAAYNFTGEIDFTSSLNNGILILNDMPLGEYTFTFTDNCGYEYTEKVTVPPFVQKEFNIATLPGCEVGFGTIRYRSGNGDLVSARITEVQGTTFGYVLPYDVTQHITDGTLYMDNLAAGTYTFEATDICGIVEAKSVNVEGYNINDDIYTYTPRCGGFSVKVTDNSNGTEGAQYWLQKYNAVTGTWGHPNSNGNPYTEGTAPENANALKLTNNTERNNINYNGVFRVIKKFETFTMGSAQNTICISQLGDTFEYVDGFRINNAYSLACANQPNDIYLDVVGYPVEYRAKAVINGQQVTINNGTSNVFTNLIPATYTFIIEDICGNTFPLQVNIETLPAIVTVNQPDDMLVCNKAGFSPDNYVFHLTDQDEKILGDQFSASYTITYHLTQEDADAAVNPLPEYYTNLTNGQTIYFRIVHNEIDLCPGTGHFQLFLGEDPQAAIIVSGIICDQGSVMLSVDKAASGYLWSTGATTRSISVTEPGEYSVVVTRDYGNRICSSEPVSVTVHGSSTPSIARIETADWTQENNSVTVTTKGEGNFEYSIDGINYQKENTFENLKTGVYKVYVKDESGCGMDMQEIVLMYYPNYFTPNHDGHHDKWRIPFSVMEPNMKVSLFDRYGKHITTFGATSEGWDGTLNGQDLPSTDYWFVVTREDGRELRGHFAMIR